MNTTPATNYSRRITGKSDMLRVRLESHLAETILKLQDNPSLTIKGTLRPSRSLIVRRALAVYATHVAQLKTPEAIALESAGIHRLA